MIRANVLEAIERGLRANGPREEPPEWLVMRSHVLRNAMLPVVTMLGMDIGVALGGGDLHRGRVRPARLGPGALQALEGFDLPAVMGDRRVRNHFA